MEYTTLGQTGLKVSKIGLGCMTFGSKSWRSWILEEEEALPFIERAIELGINFFDTANIYSFGESERILGKALDGRRDDMVVATKVFFPMDRHDPNSGGLSRKAIEQELQDSLERLDMNTIDLYQIHRWDETTPIEETMRALSDAVRQEKVRYLGASSMWAHQFARAQELASNLELERFATMQNFYNVIYREEEREMLPLCQKQGVGVIPWSPLARGYLARPHEQFQTTDRGIRDQNIDRFVPTGEPSPTINERVQEVAQQKGYTMAQISLAWLLHKDWVDAPIVGTTSIKHLEEAVEAVDITLSKREIDYLEEPYRPRKVRGHR